MLTRRPHPGLGGIGPFTPDRLMFASADVSMDQRADRVGHQRPHVRDAPDRQDHRHPCSVGEGCDGPFTLLTDYAAIAQLSLMGPAVGLPGPAGDGPAERGVLGGQQRLGEHERYMDVDANALRVDVASPHLPPLGSRSRLPAGFVPDA